MALLCMVMIFCFSAQPSEDSGEVSGVVSEQLVSTANKLFHWNLDSEKLQELAEKWDKPVRKTAHGIEYGVLAILIFLWMDCKSYVWQKHLGFSVAAAAIYAASDEIHQRFVPGRYGCVEDVFIDSLGAFVGIVILIGVRKCINSLWKKSKSAGIESSSAEKM